MSLFFSFIHKQFINPADHRPFIRVSTSVTQKSHRNVGKFWHNTVSVRGPAVTATSVL